MWFLQFSKQFEKRFFLNHIASKILLRPFDGEGGRLVSLEAKVIGSAILRRNGAFTLIQVPTNDVSKFLLV